VRIIKSHIYTGLHLPHPYIYLQIYILISDVGVGVAELFRKDRRQVFVPFSAYLRISSNFLAARTFSLHFDLYNSLSAVVFPESFSFFLFGAAIAGPASVLFMS